MEISILSLKMKRFSTSLVDWANPAVSEFHHTGELLAILYSEQQDGGMHHKKFINGVGTGCGWDFLNTLQKSTGDLRMADDGVRGGCGSGIFCPDTPVTRGQMAVFIESALGHASSTCTGQFTDVL
jgi:hypothetical protein